MLEVEGIKVGYSHMSVLHGVDLKIESGEIVALLGSNGVGKTTLNNVICGFVSPTSGSVRFEGQTITHHRPRDIVSLGIAQVPEGRKIFPNLTVAENLSLGAFRRAQNNRVKNFERVCDIFPRLKERLDQLSGTLSGGEQQMLAIGRGMMSEPELLILDEPSLGLSPLLVEEMFNLIVSINKSGVAVLLVEQNVVQSLAIAARAYVIEQGQVAMQGASKDLLHNPELQRVYLGL